MSVPVFSICVNSKAHAHNITTAYFKIAFNIWEQRGHFGYIIAIESSYFGFNESASWT